MIYFCHLDNEALKEKKEAWTTAKHTKKHTKKQANLESDRKKWASDWLPRWKLYELIFYWCQNWWWHKNKPDVDGAALKRQNNTKGGEGGCWAQLEDDLWMLLYFHASLLPTTSSMRKRLITNKFKVGVRVESKSWAFDWNMIDFVFSLIFLSLRNWFSGCSLSRKEGDETE